MADVIEGEISTGQPTEASVSRRDRLAFPALVVAMAISNTGNYLTSIAIPWFVYVTTGSASRTGLVAFAGLLPVAAAGFFGGAFVDRFGFKRSSVISDIASGLTVSAIPTLYVLDALQYWHLLVFSFLGAMLDVPGGTARDAMIPRLAGRVSMPLERANSAAQLARFGASVIGPLAAGALIAWLGAASVLFLDAASFGISALIVAAAISYPAASRGVNGAAGGDGDVPRSSLLADAFTGLRFMRGDAFLATMVSISVFANFLFAPLFSVIFPVYVKQLFDDATAFGALVASFGVGSVVGALATGAFGPRLPRYPIFAGGAVLLAAGLWALPWSPAFAVSLAAGFVMGLGIGPLNILATTIMQERVPEELLGRVFGTLFAMSTIASPLGVLLGGVAVDGFGITPVLVAIAFGVSVLAVWIIVSPAMRTAERPGTAIGNGQQATGGQEREVEL